MERFGLDRLHVTVVVDPAHKQSVAPADDRLALARLAFAELGATVEPELHAYTVDALEARRLRRPDLPDRRRRARRLPDLEGAGAGARAGAARRRHAPGLRAGDRRRHAIEIFELEPHPVSSSEIRARVRARASRSTGSCRRRRAVRIAELGLYRDA